MSLTFAIRLIQRAFFSSRDTDMDLTGYVLPSTGQANGGNTFPGVSWPLGIVKLGPDLYDGSDAYSGYNPDGNFTGFSMLHESGTGGAPKYGVVSQMPVLGKINNPLADHNDTRSAPDVSEVGFYQSFLGSGITVELAGTERAGLYQYTFPDTDPTRNVIVDVSHVLSSYRGMGLQQSYLGGNIEVVDGDTNGSYYKGYGSYDNGWNRAPKWTVYFCGHFDPAPSAYQTFLGAGNTNTSIAEYPSSDSITSTARLGVVYTFDGATNVTSRVGVSFISTEQACSNVDSQIPAGTTREELTTKTKDAWNSQVLNKVTTKEARNLTDLQLLYSSLYHMSIIPTNKTGENPLWASSEPYYDDIFTLWDLFRCSTALFHLIQPKAYEEYIRSLIDVWRNEGFMPDARSSFWNGATQGGSNGDNVLADAYVKGVRGDVNWADGYSAMATNAEVTPPNNDDPRDTTGSTKEGRGALPDWLEHGFITPSFGRSVSRAVEYSVNDFAVYTVGDGLGEANASTYLNRSRNWRNHWNPDAESLGFSGFVVPRNVTGFIEQDPLSCGGCYWGDDYYEALPWEYSWNAHHDIDTIISYCGGEESFVKRLEMMFTPGAYSSGSFDKMIFNPGNEPSFTTPYLFNFVNRQDLTVQYTRKFAKAYYAPTPSGLPGNSDAGAMETWVLWVMLGLYPMTGQTTFLVGSPWFSDLKIDLGDGKKLDITTTGGNETSYYVQSLKVNDKTWDKSWVTWSDIFENGGTMDFVLGPDPSNWTTGPPPPSPATEAAAQRGSTFDNYITTNAHAAALDIITGVESITRIPLKAASVSGATEVQTAELEADAGHVKIKRATALVSNTTYLSDWDTGLHDTHTNRNSFDNRTLIGSELHDWMVGNQTTDVAFMIYGGVGASTSPSWRTPPTTIPCTSTSSQSPAAAADLTDRNSDYQFHASFFAANEAGIKPGMQRVIDRKRASAYQADATVISKAVVHDWFYHRQDAMYVGYAEVVTENGFGGHMLCYIPEAQDFGLDSEKNTCF